MISCVIALILHQHCSYLGIFQSVKTNESHHEKTNNEKTNNVISDQDQHIPSLTSTEDGKRLEILDLESRSVLAM